MFDTLNIVRQIQPYAHKAGFSSFATVSQVFTVEGISTCRADLVPLRITVANRSTGFPGYADQVYLWPSVKIVSVHGHNIDPVVSLTFSGSTDGSTLTSLATPTPYQPSFYSALSSAADYRYYRLACAGTNSTQSGTIYIGEAVLAQSLAPGNTIRIEPQYAVVDPQVRVQTTPANSRSYLLGDRATRVLRMSFLWDSTSNWSEARDEIFLRSRNGHHPLVMVPLSSETEVIYGKIEPTLTYARPHVYLWDSREVVLTELPFPTFVA